MYIKSKWRENITIYIIINSLSASLVSSRSLTAPLTTDDPSSGRVSLRIELWLATEPRPPCGASGSTRNNSSEPLMISLAEEASVNGAVGRATPNRTGAIRESAVSHSSSTASRIIERNTRRHLLKGCVWLLKLDNINNVILCLVLSWKLSCNTYVIRRLAVLGAISTLNITNTRATERTNLLATSCAAAARPGVRSSFSSRTSVSRRISSTSR